VFPWRNTRFRAPKYGIYRDIHLTFTGGELRLDCPMRILLIKMAVIALLAGFSCVAQAARPNVPIPPRYGAISAPAWSPDGEYLAFVYHKTQGDSEVYAVSADGTGLINLSNNGAEDTNPVWGPDSRRILFTSTRKGNRDIFVADVSAGPGSARAVTVTQTDDMWPSWHPDGEKIAFCGFQEGYEQVFTTDVSGGGEPELFYEERACYPAYSPDGKRLALASYGDIVVFNLSNMKSKNITEGLISGNMVEDTMPVWSPKGNRIAFIGMYEAYSAEIYTISPTGKTVRRITDELFEDFFPRWAPDGKGVIYAAFADGQPPEIFISDPKSPEKDRITDNYTVEMSPCLKPPDGNKIVYVRRDGSRDELYIMNGDGSGKEPFLKEELPRLAASR